MNPNTERDRGSIMPMTTIFVASLMLATWSLLSASQQWGARRDAYATAAAAARAGAQADPALLRQGVLVDPDAATERAQRVLAAAGMAGSVVVDGATVTVSVIAPVSYAFPAPGFPTEVTGSATAVARRGVNGDEGG